MNDLIHDRGVVRLGSGSISTGFPPLKRRHLLMTAALAPVAGALAACSSTGSTSSMTPTQVITDIGLVAGGLAGALPGLVTAGLPAASIASVTGLVNQIQSAADAVSASLTTTAAAPIVTQIVGVLAQIAATVGPALPAPFGTALAAAQILLPVIAAAVGLVSSAPSTAAVSMTHAEARAALASMIK